MNLNLKGKSVLVSGASKGIGKAIAQAFAAEGSRVALNARNEKKLAAAADTIQKTGGDSIAIAGDVTRSDDVDRIVREVVSRFGTVHVLINNAGGIGRFATFEQLSDEEWTEIMNLNIFSAVRMRRAVLPHMRKKKGGRIINISSESDPQPDAEMPHYNASKAAMNNLS